MATKLQLISELSKSTSKQLSGYDNWTAFLRSAAWQYKYPFEDQLLIFAQRPDAKACADFDTWNEKLHRRIKRGAKGIALLREGNRGYYLDYVFDVSDTHRHINGIDINLWQYNDRFDDAIIETLENTFGELQVTTTLTDAIICAAHNAVEDNKTDYLSELKYAKYGSFLEDLDELNIDVEFQRTVESSVAYMVTITEYEYEDISNDEDLSIPADPNVKNFSYTVVDGNIYFRENSIMRKVEMNSTAENRIKGMIGIRDCVRELIEYQTEGYLDADIKAQQEKLNTLYDGYTKKYGLINSRGNAMAFSDDSSYFLLCSLEVLDENGELERKADMFTKRTIGAKTEITKVDTASEALAVSLGEKARIDIEFMSSLSGKSEEELCEELKGVIFLNPLYDDYSVGHEKYLTADEYLSGNVRNKLRIAKEKAEENPEFAPNVEALTRVQPQDLTASEITVRLGSTWIPPEYIKQFTFELLETSYYARSRIDVKYSDLSGEWMISGKSVDKGVKAVKHKEIRNMGYCEYDNYNAIEVPYTDAIPSDYDGIMGVPISFLDKYCPEQFEIIELSRYLQDGQGMSQQFVDDYYAQGNTGQISAGHPDLCYYDKNGKAVVPYMRILIKPKGDLK